MSNENKLNVRHVIEKMLQTAWDGLTGARDTLTNASNSVSRYPTMKSSRQM
jgi:hypothetical protein